MIIMAIDISIAKIRSKLEKYVRVLKITKKPSREEFVTSIKVTGIGIILIGAIGFAIFLAISLLGIQ